MKTTTKNTAKTSTTAAEKARAIETLKHMLPVNEPITLHLQSVSSTPSSRARGDIRHEFVVLAIDSDDGEIVNVSDDVALVLGLKQMERRGGVVVHGSGCYKPEQLAQNIIKALGRRRYEGYCYRLV